MRTRLLACAVALALAASACGGGGDDDEADASDTTASGSASEAEAGGAASSVEEAEAAVIQIIATGTFVDPEIGVQYDAAGAGSGFIIDESGLAVTNNHVVTGAATLEVFVAGEDEPVNAKVLGASECADLAVIDLEGDGYEHLAWYEGKIDTNLDVRALGFPLGDPEYTVTRGIVSKAEADGDTDWASVDSIIEHDAKIQPGSSGGPLVDDSGRVVGVNFAGLSETDQNFAISADQARDVVERLQEGETVESIGINGQAIFDEATGTTGVWVASVESGSPADEIGITGGDIVLTLENLGLAYEGTMKEYCDVLQSHEATDKLKVEVLRYETQEVLAGEINGDPLVQSFSFAEEFGDEVVDAEETTGGAVATYTEYVMVSDDSGAIQVEVPVEWADVSGAPNELGPSVIAATSIEGFDAAWDDPGVRITATNQVDGTDQDALLDELALADCVSQGREDYSDPLYTGRLEFFTDCAGTTTAFVTLVASPEDASYVVLVAVQLVSDADLDALDRIKNTFQVVGTI